jgi:hypothetical protein
MTSQPLAVNENLSRQPRSLAHPPIFSLSHQGKNIAGGGVPVAAATRRTAEALERRRAERRVPSVVQVDHILRLRRLR